MKTNIRVLLVEDDKVDQQAFQRFVAEQRLPYDLSVAGSVADATAALGVATFDIIIVDYSLGDGTALDILAQAKDMPVVVVTGTGSEATAVNALKKGAYDYLIKDLDRKYLKIMPITVENAIRRFMAEETNKRFYAELETRVKERTRELVEANRLQSESEKKYRTLAESAQDHIYIIGRDFRVQYVNPYGAAYFAKNRINEIVGKTVDELFPREAAEKLVRSIGMVFETGKVLREEAALISTTGQAIWVDAQLIPLKNEKGDVERIMGMSRDLTERKRSEEKISKLNEDLRQRIAELEEARILAEAGMRARGAFLANISHELITPLNSIIGFSQILLDGLGGPMNEQQKEYAASILQGGNRLHETLKEIVQFAGLESGEMQLHPDRFLLKDLLKSSLLAFNEKAAVQGVTLSLEIGLPPETELEADRGKLQQVLFNLLDNAVKFTPKRGAVRVSARRKEAEKVRSRESEKKPTDLLPSCLPTFLTSGTDLIEISVADTGIGINEDDLSRLFRSFEQLESPYTKKYKGTGLGLMLAKKLIELHGGKIWVESEFGKGSTFIFAIPVVQNAEDRSQ